MKHLTSTDRSLSALILVVLSLGACKGIQMGSLRPPATMTSSEPGYTATYTLPAPTDTPRPAPTHTHTPQATHTAQPSETPTDTPTATPVPRDTQVRAALLAVVASEYWPLEGLSPESIAAWEAFARGTQTPSDAQLSALEAFLALWEERFSLLQAGTIPAKALPSLRARQYEDQQGNTQFVPYVVDLNSSSAENAESLFLIAHDKSGDAVHLLLAPQIQGLSQRISPDGEYVEYFDERGGWLVKADARPLDKSVEKQATLKEMLDENATRIDYFRHSIYPRFYYNIAEIEAGFYAFEELTHNQILLLKSTLELFDRPELAAFKPQIFASGEAVEYIVSRRPHPVAAAMALPYGGTPRQGIIILVSKNLFNNRYDTAASLAHEAAHIWQGVSPSCDEPEKRLRIEIGDGTIAPDFYTWSAEEVIKAAKTRRIGAYHVSVWVLQKFNQTDHVRWMEDLIRNGQRNMQGIINCQ